MLALLVPAGTFVIKRGSLVCHVRKCCYVFCFDLCTCVVMIYLDLVKQDQIAWKPALKKRGYMTAVIAVPALIGCIVYKCLCTRLKVTFTQNNAFVFADSLESMWNNLWFGVRDLFGCFGFDGGVQLLSIAGLRNFVSVVICGWLTVMYMNQREEFTPFYYCRKKKISKLERKLMSCLAHLLRPL